jgi:hypothetical protein
MLAFIAVISGIFGAGFTFGYAIRDAVSRRRRRQFFQERYVNDAADHPSFIPDTSELGFVPVSSPLLGLPAEAPQGGKLNSNEKNAARLPPKVNLTPR